MKIVIDARFWGAKHTGLGIYTQKLVENLLAIDKKNTYTLLLREKIDLPVDQIVVNAEAYSLKEQLALLPILYKTSPDLVHFPSINVPILYFGNYVVTVHDLIKHQSKGTASTTHFPLLYWIKYLTYLLVTKIIVLRSKKIIVPSMQVKREISEHFKLSPDKIIVTYEAPGLSQTKKTGLTVNLPVKFAIYTGNAYPHKNLEKLVAAWPKIFARTKMELVISSGRNVFSAKIGKMIEKYSAQKFVHYKGFLSDQQLSYAYSQATMYVFPSLLEGFGLPGLDAMNTGLPVVCSDIPVLREVYGKAAVYFDPKNEEDMVQKITTVAADKEIRKNLIEEGSKQVKKYSWQKMARETMEVYESTVSSRT